MEGGRGGSLTAKILMNQYGDPMLLAALSVSMLSWLLGPSLPEACPATESVINVYSTNPGFTVDHAKSRAELGGLMGQKAFPGFYTQGLTDVTYSTAPRFLIASHELADGRWCASLKRANVEFGLGEPARVHIAREIPEESCRYVTVLAHEMQHVGISQRTVGNAVEELQRALSNAAPKTSPAFGKSEEAASDVLKASLQKIIDDVTRRYIARAEFENASIDTRQSYEALSAQCPGSAY
ncbi:hypothetical protein D3C71_489110 [compost metagenome]